METMGYKYRYWWKNRFLLGLAVSILLHGGLILVISARSSRELTTELAADVPLRVRLVSIADGMEEDGTAENAEIAGEEVTTDLTDGMGGNGTSEVGENAEGNITAEVAEFADGMGEDGTTEIAEEDGTTDLTDRTGENGTEEITEGDETPSGTMDGAGELFAALTEGLVLARPVYPEVARRWGYEGLVVVEIFVSADGEVEKVSLLESSGYEVLDQTVLRTVGRKWAFHPPGRPLSIQRSFEFFLE